MKCVSHSATGKHKWSAVVSLGKLCISFWTPHPAAIIIMAIRIIQKTLASCCVLSVPHQVSPGQNEMLGLRCLDQWLVNGLDHRYASPLNRLPRRSCRIHPPELGYSRWVRLLFQDFAVAMQEVHAWALRLPLPVPSQARRCVFRRPNPRPRTTRCALDGRDRCRRSRHRHADCVSWEC